MRRKTTWIVADPEHLGNTLRLRSHPHLPRLVGMTLQEIVREYPSFSEEAIRGDLEELAHSDLLAVP